MDEGINLRECDGARNRQTKVAEPLGTNRRVFGTTVNYDLGKVLATTLVVRESPPGGESGGRTRKPRKMKGRRRSIIAYGLILEPRVVTHITISITHYVEVVTDMGSEFNKPREHRKAAQKFMGCEKGHASLDPNLEVTRPDGASTPLREEQAVERNPLAEASRKINVSIEDVVREGIKSSHGIGTISCNYYVARVNAMLTDIPLPITIAIVLVGRSMDSWLPNALVLANGERQSKAAPGRITVHYSAIVM